MDFVPDIDEFMEKEASRFEFLKGAEKEEHLRLMYSSALEFGLDRYYKYKSDLGKLMYVILDSLDRDIILRLKHRENWDERNYDTIQLLKSLREFCYDVNFRRVHPAVELIQKMQQFLGCKQKQGQCVYDYVAEVQSHYNVLKLIEGLSTFRTPIIEDTIENKFPEFRDVDYSSLSDENKMKIDEATDQRVVALVILEGSKPSWKNSYILLFAEVAGVRYNKFTRQYESRESLLQLFHVQQWGTEKFRRRMSCHSGTTSVNRQSTMEFGIWLLDWIP